MQDEKDIRYLLLAFVGGVLVMFCLWMAVNVFLPAPDTESTYRKERAVLEAKLWHVQRVADSLAKENDAMADTIAALTAQPKAITKRHDTIRQQNWNLPATDAADLLHQRLAADSTYRMRFVYGAYAH